MASNIVFVTATEYITVSPSPTALPSFSILEPTPTSPMTISTSATMTDHISTEPHSMGTTLSSIISTTIKPLPSAGLPAAKPPTSSRDDSLPGLMAGLIVILGILLFSFLSWVIYLRIRGECPQCKETTSKLKKWESGELKVITKEMVKEREFINTLASSKTHYDLESQKQDPSRLTAWSNAMASLTGSKKSMKRAQAEEFGFSSRASSSYEPTGDDRYFTVGDLKDESLNGAKIADQNPQVSLRPPTTYNDTLDSTVLRAPSSVYSRPTNSVIGRPFIEHDIPSATLRMANRPEQISSTEQFQTVNLKDDESFGPASRHRSRAYGGLPDPEKLHRAASVKKPKGNWF